MNGPRTHYNHDLAEVQRALLQLNAAVQRAVSRSLHALVHNDTAAARQIMREDDDIDERRADVEERALRLIAGQQPLASDLRFLLSALRIADDLERMGDYAEGIAALVVRDAAEPMLTPPPELNQMADLVQRQLVSAVTAFVDRNAAVAAALEHADDEIDDLNRVVQSAMLRHIQARPREATRALHFLFVGHNLERIADRAVNIAERAAFIATGIQPAVARRGAP